MKKKISPQDIFITSKTKLLWLGDESNIGLAEEIFNFLKQGSYTVAGDLLTVVPKRSITAVKNREGVVVRTETNALETTGYRWTLHYFAGLQETQLVLQTGAETNRDGAFASNDLFPNSYILGQKYKPEWKF